MEQLPHIENTFYLYFSYLLLLFSLLIQSGESIYEPPHLKCIWWHLQYISRTKLLFPLVFISVICLLSRPIQSISTDSAYFLDPNKSLFVIVVLLLRYFGIVVFWYVIVVFHYCGIKQIIMKIIIITIIIIMIIILIILIIIIITMMIIMIIIMKNKVTSSHWYF